MRQELRRDTDALVTNLHRDARTVLLGKRVLARIGKRDAWRGRVSSPEWAKAWRETWPGVVAEFDAAGKTPDPNSLTFPGATGDITEIKNRERELQSARAEVVAAVRAAGFIIVPIPGASALTALLTAWEPPVL